MEATKNITVGTPIFYKGDMANEEGYGAVVAVVTRANTLRAFTMNWASSRMEEFDASVSYDIVLEDGRRFPGVFVSNIGGTRDDKTCRFMLVDALPWGGSSIDALLAGATARDELAKVAAKAKSEAFEKSKAAALEAGKAMGLIPEAEFKATGKRGMAATFNLRAELKANGIKARVKADGYTSIDVDLADAADYEKAKAIGRKYEAGSFDGMTDCYEYRPGAWGEVFGDVRYVFVRKPWA